MPAQGKSGVGREWERLRRRFVVRSSEWLRHCVGDRAVRQWLDIFCGQPSLKEVHHEEPDTTLEMDAQRKCVACNCGADYSRRLYAGGCLDSGCAGPNVRGTA